MIGTIKIRCPVCKGTGWVEPGFGSANSEPVSAEYTRRCPACNGTGMQEVSYVMELPINPLPEIPNNLWKPAPQYVPPTAQNPCESCWWTLQMRARKEPYVGDSPCQWCPHGPKVTCDSHSGGRG